MLSVTDQSGEARYPSFKGIMAAKKKPLDAYSLSDLGIDAGEVGLSVAWSQVEDTTERPPRTAGEIVTDEDGSGAGALVEFLASNKFDPSRAGEQNMSEVLVVVDHADGEVQKPTYELLTIAKRLGEPVAVFFGLPDQGDAVAEKVKKYGAAKVYVVDDAQIKGFLVAPKAEALQQLAEQASPAAILAAVDVREQGGRRPSGDQAGLGPDHRRRRRAGGCV